MLAKLTRTQTPAKYVMAVRYAATAQQPKPAAQPAKPAPAAAKPAPPPPRPGPPKLTESPMDYPLEIEHNAQVGNFFLFSFTIVHPIQSRFAVPPHPQKETRINPDIKRLQPTPANEKHREVSGWRMTPNCVGSYLPDR
jgi:hypothetical protein